MLKYECKRNGDISYYQVNCPLGVTGILYRHAAWYRCSSRRPSPLAISLTQIPGVTWVGIGREFLSIGKTPAMEWPEIHESIVSILESVE